MGNNVFFRKKLFYTKISLCFQKGFLLYEKNYKKTRYNFSERNHCSLTFNFLPCIHYQDILWTNNSIKNCLGK